MSGMLLTITHFWQYWHQPIAVEVNMPESTRSRACNSTKDSDALFAPSKRICIPIERAEYERILGDRIAFRKYLDEIIRQSPELFPAMIQHGYQLHDMRPPSKKMPDIRLRHIKVTSAEDGEEVFSVVPSFVMPYMMGYSDEVEKALREASDDLGSPFGA